jgi:D-3-phosphoglycerate dehydrogenase
MKIVLNAEPYNYSERARLTWEEKGYCYYASSWDEIYSVELWPEVEILIVRLAKKIDFEILLKFPSLKKIITATTGHDHIDLNALRDRSIDLVSLRGHDIFLKTIPSTAEHTWALLMALIRHIPAANEDVKSGNWQRDKFRGYQLKNKVIGIIGYGRTGKKVASYADAFDMHVQYYDPYVEEPDVKHRKNVDLINLLASSDIISLHVHLNENTVNLINIENIENAKRGALFINTSRGGIWDETAVIHALEKGKLTGVATDVLTTELSEIKNSPLWQAQQKGHNILITPHIAGATQDAMWQCEDFLSLHESKSYKE